MHRRPRAFLGGMQRIIVIGTSGSGKTTFARALANRLGFPHGEQDAWNHEAGWREAPLGRFRARVDLFTSGRQWVMDGNYSKARDIGWARADTLVWLDYSAWVVYPRIMRRTFFRVMTRQELWNGNRETWRGVLAAEAPLRWFWRTHWKRRREMPELAAQYPNLTLVRLRTPGEAARWLQNINLQSINSRQPA